MIALTCSLFCEYNHGVINHFLKKNRNILSMSVYLDKSDIMTSYQVYNRFFFELDILKKIHRQGWKLIGISEVDTVAGHSLQEDRRDRSQSAVRRRREAGSSRGR